MVDPRFWPTVDSRPLEEQAGIREILYNWQATQAADRSGRL
ncbi:Hypothetical protein NGAL_HAMBI2610_20380 [Neorhizobium galegae bv. orientalis]|nr:Hypothetical protein NGAL_HAMBI2610_20380 [Neorhizobium galegae bv. orientalis]